MPRVESTLCGDHMKDGCALSQMKDGTVFGTKEAHVRATTLCVRQSLDPFLSLRPLPNRQLLTGYVWLAIEVTIKARYRDSKRIIFYTVSKRGGGGQT